jgi:hypothetical protein
MNEVLVLQLSNFQLFLVSIFSPNGEFIFFGDDEKYYSFFIYFLETKITIHNNNKKKKLIGIRKNNYIKKIIST